MKIGLTDLLSLEFNAQRADSESKIRRQTDPEYGFQMNRSG